MRAHQATMGVKTVLFYADSAYGLGLGSQRMTD